MTAAESTVARISAILPWAQIVGELRNLPALREHQVHLRPSGTGIRLVDLSPDRPQLDRGKISSHVDARAKLEQLLDVGYTEGPLRPTPEKRLQSYLIAEAYRQGGTLRSLSSELTFVTDEQVLPTRDGRVVVDLLALRRSSTRATPVVVELKSARKLKELVAQLDAASTIVDANLASFSQLYSTLLSTDVHFTGPCERWLVWPATEHEVDPRKAELARQKITVVSYREHASGYRFIQ